MKINCLKRLLFPLLLAAGTAAQALPDGVAVNEDGTFRIGEAKFQIQAWLSGWRSRINSNWSNRKVERQEGDFHLDGTFTVNNVAGTVRETLRSAGTEQFRLDCAFEFPTPVQLMALHATMSIPGTLREFSADGKKVRLPEEYRDTVNMPAFRAEDMSLAVVEARGHEKDTGGLTFSFGVLHQSGVLVEYRCDGLTAQAVWELVEETLAPASP